jgi:hypothetical protein
MEIGVMLQPQIVTVESSVLERALIEIQRRIKSVMALRDGYDHDLENLRATEIGLKNAMQIVGEKS